MNWPTRWSRGPLEGLRLSHHLQMCLLDARYTSIDSASYARPSGSARRAPLLSSARAKPPRRTTQRWTVSVTVRTGERRPSSVANTSISYLPGTRCRRRLDTIVNTFAPVLPWIVNEATLVRRLRQRPCTRRRTTRSSRATTVAVLASESRSAISRRPATARTAYESASICG
jgi:hypothetical protein